MTLPLWDAEGKVAAPRQSARSALYAASRGLSPLISGSPSPDHQFSSKWQTRDVPHTPRTWAVAFTNAVSCTSDLSKPRGTRIPTATLHFPHFSSGNLDAKFYTGNGGEGLRPRRCCVLVFSQFAPISPHFSPTGSCSYIFHPVLMLPHFPHIFPHCPNLPRFYGAARGRILVPPPLAFRFR